MKSIIRKCLTALVSASAIFAVSCQDELESPTTMTLAVNDTIINLGSKSGSEHVLVYAKGQWSTEFKEAVNWVSIEDGKGNGNGEFILKFEKNPEILRRAEIVLSASGVEKTITLTVNQEGEKGTPKLSFETNEKNYIAWEVKDAIAFESNVKESLLTATSSVDWISGLELKDGKLSFTVTENTTGAERRGALTIAYTDMDEQVYRTVAEITQGSDPGHIILNEAEMSIEAFSGTKTAAWDCVLGTFLPDLKYEVTYMGEAKDWISNVTMTAEALSFDVTDNDLPAARTAVIKVDLESKNVTAELKVTQGIKTRQYSFQELRETLTSAGEKTFVSDWFEAVAIADAGKENMETNKMLSSGTYSTDESLITNYVQSVDGRFGIRLKFASAADNTLKKGDKVKISLAGTTLVREEYPARYTLKGLTANNITLEGTTELPVRRRLIDNLIDEDIYTWTTLEDVDIAFCYGSYNNVGSSVKTASDWIKSKKQNMDYRILSDAWENTIKMLVNSDVTWLRTQDGVPQGSGDVSGVIVCTDNGRFHDSELLGKYQIRPMDLSDIAIGDTGFSEKLVEWYWPKGKASGNNDGTATWNASVGTGTLTSSIGKLNQTASYLETASNNDTKALRWDSTTAAPWWNTTEGKAGGAITAKFSSEAAAGKEMVAVFSATIGGQTEDTKSQAPVHWTVTCSWEGATIPVYLTTALIRPVPPSNSTKMNFPLALDEYYVKLPSEASGKSEVTITLTPADDAAVDFATGEYTAKAVSTVAQTFRFGAFVVKYIK